MDSKKYHFVNSSYELHSEGEGDSHSVSADRTPGRKTGTEQIDIINLLTLFYL